MFVTLTLFLAEIYQWFLKNKMLHQNEMRWLFTACSQISSNKDRTISFASSVRIVFSLHLVKLYDLQKHLEGRPTLPCRNRSETDQVLHIRTTTLSFLNTLRHSTHRPYASSPSQTRVCFCFHASHEELIDFLGYFKPRRAQACVTAYHDTSLQEVSEGWRSRNHQLK